MNMLDWLSGFGLGYIIFIQNVQFVQVSLHRLWSHQREERIDTIFGEVVWKCAQEESTKGTTETKRIRISLTIRKSPGC
jgi:hypothetical protein